MTISIKNPAFCETLPRNTSKFANVYKEYIKKGQWDKVESNCVLYSEAVEEYLACKQQGINCGFSIREPKAPDTKRKLNMILSRLGACERDLFTSKPVNPAPKATINPSPKATINSAPKQKAEESFEIPESIKAGIKDLLKMPISSTEREIAYSVMDNIARTDKSIFDELNIAARELNLVSADEVVVAMFRSLDTKIDASELEAFYKLLKKYGNPADVADIIIESMKPDSDDEVAAILTQITQDIINGIKKAGCIDEDTVNILSLVLPEDEIVELRKMATPSGVICLPDKGGAKQEQKEPAVQVDNSSKPGEKAKQAAPDNSDRKNGFVNNNLQIVTSYPGCKDIIDFASAQGYSTKLAQRGDGFITAEIFAKGIQDPVSKLTIDPGHLYPASLGYAIMIPDGGSPAAPAFSDIIMSDYVYINDTQEANSISWIMAGNKPTELWLKDLKEACYTGKKINAIIEYSSLPDQPNANMMYLLGKMADRLFEKGVRIRGSITEVQQNSITVQFRANAGSLKRYYQNKKYGDFTITVSIDTDGVSLNVNGSKKSAKLKKLIAGKF